MVEPDRTRRLDRVLSLVLLLTLPRERASQECRPTATPTAVAPRVRRPTSARLCSTRLRRRAVRQARRSHPPAPRTGSAPSRAHPATPSHSQLTPPRPTTPSSSSVPQTATTRPRSKPSGPCTARAGHAACGRPYSGASGSSSSRESCSPLSSPSRLGAGEEAEAREVGTRARRSATRQT